MKPFYTIVLTIIMLMSAVHIKAQVLSNTHYSENFNGPSTPAWMLNTSDAG